MADIDSQVSFSVKTDSGEVRSMTPEEINSFVRQTIERASSRKGTKTPSQQTRRRRMARTPSPVSKFVVTKPTEVKGNNVDESQFPKPSLDEVSLERPLATPRNNSKPTSPLSPPSMKQYVRPTLDNPLAAQVGSVEEEKRSLSVDRDRQTSSPDRRDGIEKKKEYPIESDVEFGRETSIGTQSHDESELQINVPTLLKMTEQSPEVDNDFPECISEPALIKRRTPSQTERKLKKAARNKASRRRADVSAATKISADSEPFDEIGPHSRVEDTFSDPSMKITQKDGTYSYEIQETALPQERMSQPEIDMLIKQSINKARQARKVAAIEIERKGKEHTNIEPKSRFDELTGMSPIGGKNRRFSWSSVEDLDDDASTLDGTKSPTAILEEDERSGRTATLSPHDNKEVAYRARRSDMLAARMGLRTTRSPYDQIASTETELSLKPKEISVSTSNNLANEAGKTIETEIVKKGPEDLQILTATSPLSIPFITNDRIYSQHEISAIVLLSMEKAQQAARDEITSLLLTPKASDPKSPMAAKLAARLRVPSQEEVTSIAREAMHRAREAAQDEIRTLIRESFRCAQDSSQEQIRQIVRESMQRARSSAREEMSDLVRTILRQGMDTQHIVGQGGNLLERKPEMIEAEKLLTAKLKEHTATDSSDKPTPQLLDTGLPNQVGVEEEEILQASPTNVDNDQLATSNSEKTNIAELLSRVSEHISISTSPRGERSLTENLGLNMALTPKSKFSFSQVDTHDADDSPSEIQPSNQSIQGNLSPGNELSPTNALSVQVSSVPLSPGVVSFGSWNSANQHADVHESGNAMREPTGEHSNSGQAIVGTSSPVIFEPDEVGEGQHSVHNRLPSNSCNIEEELLSVGGNRDYLNADTKNLEGKMPLAEGLESKVSDTLAADTSMIPLSDEHEPEEALTDNNTKTEHATKHGNARRQTKNRTPRARYASGMASPLSSAALSDASTHSSFSAAVNGESMLSVDSQSRQTSRKNRYRSEENEAVVTDEFLELIASKKGTRITAQDLSELIKQQNISSPSKAGGSRLAKRSESHGSQSFGTLQPASFEKQPRFCMVANFLNFWEHFDLFLEDQGSEYPGNEIFSFSTHGGSYTEFEDDDDQEEDSCTDDSQFEANVVLSFSLQEEESSVSEAEDVPKKRGWW